uniref:Uncharacterized protein n=1 Tax=Pipistrellus kuhlii TaxID=59472 RepID=A0A7J7V0A9_PIPKU|nr:hypothetical protein mPipKuh1_008617 [Pipistrellus kuhlii]
MNSSALRNTTAQQQETRLWWEVVRSPGEQWRDLLYLEKSGSGCCWAPPRWSQVFPIYLWPHTAWLHALPCPPWGACRFLSAAHWPPGFGGGAIMPAARRTSRLRRVLSSGSDMVRTHSCVFLPSAAVIKKLHFHLLSHFRPLPAFPPGST